MTKISRDLWKQTEILSDDATYVFEQASYWEHHGDPDGKYEDRVLLGLDDVIERATKLRSLIRQEVQS